MKVSARCGGPRERPMSRRGFTLVELLLVIAIMAVMASLVITAISNAAFDSRDVLARQQQAVVQQALNSWIARNSSGNLDLATARTAYNGAATGLAKLALLQPYLDTSTYEHLTNFTTNANQIASDAMIRNGLYLEFTTWDTNTYPRVNLGP